MCSSDLGGSISLSGSTVTLDQAKVSAQTSGSGRGGAIRVNADTLILENGGELSTSSLQEPTSPLPSGPAGTIAINANGPNSVHLRGGSVISSTTSSANALRNPSDLGSITITTPHLSLAGGSHITTSSTGNARGGTIRLNVNGVRPILLTEGSSVSASCNGCTDRGGDIAIDTRAMVLDGASAIRADGGSGGRAGNIRINLQQDLLLARGSRIDASTSGRGGSSSDQANINIRVGGDLWLSNGSSIRASALGYANGGNLQLNVGRFLFAGFPPQSNGNDILASAYFGNGGRIDVKALGIFGVNLNTFESRVSDASARSRQGRNGVVSVITPFLTPDRGVIPIAEPLDPSNDVVRACAPRADGRRAEFSQSGRGGLPHQPGDLPSSLPPLEDLGQPEPLRSADRVPLGSIPAAAPGHTPAASARAASAPDAAAPLALAIGSGPELPQPPLPPCP